MLSRTGSNKRLKKDKEILFPVHIHLPSYRVSTCSQHKTLSSELMLALPQFQQVGLFKTLICQLQKTIEKIKCCVKPCNVLSCPSDLH